jgi:hypothetical protein
MILETLPGPLELDKADVCGSFKLVTIALQADEQIDALTPHKVTSLATCTLSVAELKTESVTFETSSMCRVEATSHARKSFMPTASVTPRLF